MSSIQKSQFDSLNNYLPPSLIISSYFTAGFAAVTFTAAGFKCTRILCSPDPTPPRFACGLKRQRWGRPVGLRRDCGERSCCWGTHCFIGILTGSNHTVTHTHTHTDIQSKYALTYSYIFCWHHSRHASTLSSLLMLSTAEHRWSCVLVCSSGSLLAFTPAFLQLSLI